MEVQRKMLENQSKMHTSKSRERITLPKSITKKNHKFKENASIIYLLSKMKRKFSFRRTTTIKHSKKLIRTDSKLKEAFNRYDTDRDGRVNPSKLGILIRSLGGNPTEAQVEEIVRMEKLNDPFDFQRFLDLMGKHLRAEPVDREVRRAFKVIDQDSDGYVTVSDLRQLLTTAGERLDPNEFDEWIREVGVGPDGRVRYEDVIAPLMVAV